PVRARDEPVRAASVVRVSGRRDDSMKRRLRAWPRLGFVVPLVPAILLGASGAASAGTAGALPGHQSPAAGSSTPVTSCASLAQINLAGVPGAPGKITSSAVVTDKLPAGPVSFCDVKGVFAPHTHFEIKLPVTTWHGQYVQEGCEALCGSVPLSDYPGAGLTCAATQDGELALAADDEGHPGGLYDGLWAKDSLALRVVFGLTSEHSLAQVAKAVITTQYLDEADHLADRVVIIDHSGRPGHPGRAEATFWQQHDRGL